MTPKWVDELLFQILIAYFISSFWEGWKEGKAQQRRDEEMWRKERERSKRMNS